MSIEKELEPEYEDMTIWQLAADFDKEMPDEKFKDIFLLAEKEYQMHARHNGLSREKHPPLENNTVWGIAAILDMLPAKRNEITFLQSDDQVLNRVDILDDPEDVFDEALKIYCERVNSTDIRANSPTPPKLTVIK